MTRKLVLTLSAVILLAAGAWLWREHALQHAPLQAAQPATQTGDTPMPAASRQQAAAAQAASGQTASAAPSGPVGSAQAADAGSTSLEHLAALPANSAPPESSQWKAGENYDVLSPAQATTVAPGKVEVLEVFWLGCPHCYALEPYIRAWLKTKPAYVQFVRVPVMWGAVHRAHARLYYTLEALGRDDLVEKVFTYIHDVETQSQSESVLVSNSEQDTFKQQQAWAVQNGVNGDAFAKAYNSFYVNTQLQQADEITNAYQVQGVPFIAVDGKYGTDVGKASGGDDPNKLISLINFLAAWEHDHRQGGAG